MFRRPELLISKVAFEIPKPTTLIKGEVESSFEHCCKTKIGFLPCKLKIPTLIDLVATSLRSFIFSIKLIREL